MIIRCPSCDRGYRLDDSRVERHHSLRCSACKHQFRIDEPPTEDTAEKRPAAASPPPPEMTPHPAAAAVPTDGRRVVLADAMRPFRGILMPLLDDLGCHVELAAEGIDAFRRAVASRPDVLIASVHLPGLSGVAICEGVKGSPHLKAIKVALVGSSLSADLFNRDTARAHGADLFLEEEMSPESLRHAITGLLGGTLASGGQAPSPAGTEEASGIPDPAAGPDAEIGVLARLMLSDLRLYYPERYEQAVRTGTLFEVFSDELTKGRAMLDERYPEVAERHKILAAALREGVASSSGMRTN